MLMKQDATGTWNGPAPTGARGQAAATAAATVKSVVVQEPATTLLSTGQRMPMIGLGTCGIKSPDVIKKALELGYRHFDCEVQCVASTHLQCFLLSLRALEGLFRDFSGTFQTVSLLQQAVSPGIGQ
jgi:hypothetical protein